MIKLFTVYASDSEAIQTLDPRLRRSHGNICAIA